MESKDSSVIAAPYHVAAISGDDVVELAKFMSVYHAKGYANEYARHSGKKVYVCKMEIVYATAGGAQ